MKQISIEFRSFFSSHLRTFRVVIKNLNYTTSTSDIFEAWATLSYTVISVSNALKLIVVLQLFEFKTRWKYNELFKILSIFNTPIKIENPQIVNRDPPEFHN